MPLVLELDSLRGQQYLTWLFMQIWCHSDVKCSTLQPRWHSEASVPKCHKLGLLQVSWPATDFQIACRVKSPRLPLHMCLRMLRVLPLSELTYMRLQMLGKPCWMPSRERKGTRKSSAPSGSLQSRIPRNLQPSLRRSLESGTCSGHQRMQRQGHSFLSKHTHFLCLALQRIMTSCGTAGFSPVSKRMQRKHESRRPAVMHPVSVLL